MQLWMCEYQFAEHKLVVSTECPHIYSVCNKGSKAISDDSMDNILKTVDSAYNLNIILVFKP